MVMIEMNPTRLRVKAESCITSLLYPLAHLLAPQFLLCNASAKSKSRANVIMALDTEHVQPTLIGPNINEAPIRLEDPVRIKRGMHNHCPDHGNRARHLGDKPLEQPKRRVFIDALVKVRFQDSSAHRFCRAKVERHADHDDALEVEALAVRLERGMLSDQRALEQPGRDVHAASRVAHEEELAWRVLCELSADPFDGQPDVLAARGVLCVVVHADEAVVGDDDVQAEAAGEEVPDVAVHEAVGVDGQLLFAAHEAAAVAEEEDGPVCGAGLGWRVVDIEGLSGLRAVLECLALRLAYLGGICGEQWGVNTGGWPDDGLNVGAEGGELVHGEVKVAYISQLVWLDGKGEKGCH